MMILYIILFLFIFSVILLKIINLSKKASIKNERKNKQNDQDKLISYQIYQDKEGDTEIESKIEIENFSNPKYQKFKETSVPILKTKQKTEETVGNLDQCKIQCDAKKDCIGFMRDKIADSATGKCYLISNVINCHNEYREPSEKYLMGEGISKNIYHKPDKFFEFDTYFKLDVSPMEKDSIQKCVKLNMTTGISPRKYPFSILVMDDNNNLSIMEKDKYVDSQDKLEDELFYSKYSVFSIVKGLSGKGVSFKINKNNSDFYVLKKADGENLSLEVEEDSLQFKQSASFILDLEYPENETMEFKEVKYISIKHEHKGVILYWKVNEVTQKIVLENKEKLGKDLEDIMFEFKFPLPFKPEQKAPEEIMAPEPSPVEIEKEVNPQDEMKSMSEELERLELDIREAQHQQNLKLMNIMLDVNKFKLQDLSMSDYLTKCVRTSEEPPTYVDEKIKSNNRKYLEEDSDQPKNRANDTNNNNNNSSNEQIISKKVNV